MFFFALCLSKEKNLMHKRGREAITRDILEATLTPRKKMRIMYKANLNYVRFNKYFGDFLKKGFIEATRDPEGNMCYSISQRGKTLLAVLNKANELGFSDEF